MKPLNLLLLFTLVITSCTTLQNYRAARAYETKLADSSAKDNTVTSVTARRDSQNREARLLSAFFGLDDALPKLSKYVICEGADGNDGMPVIFSHEIDVSTMQAGDFKVTTASGKVGNITCVTLAPADDRGELRTALLAGHYGSIDDQPAKVEIVGNLLSIDQSVNFKGASIKTIKLEKGPTMILAQVIAPGKWQLGKKATQIPWGGGNECPVGTKQVINVTWVGGVTKPGGDEADDKERVQYKVTVKLNGSKKEVTPFALADLGDGDNNHKLCLDVAGTPESVFFPAGFLTDPRDDLNPDTRVDIQK